jgi:hypothetical protein
VFYCRWLVWLFFAKNWDNTFRFVKQYFDVSKEKANVELEAEKEAALIGVVSEEKVVSSGVG